MKNNIKKLGRLWPLLIICAVAAVVLILCIKKIAADKAQVDTSLPTVSSTASFAVPTKEPEADLPSSPVESSVVPDTVITEAPVSNLVTTPIPSVAPIETDTPVPTATLEIVTVIDNNVYEYTDDSYAHVDETSSDTSDAATQIIRLINQTRNEYGLSGLYYDDSLAAVASLRVQEITTNFSHTRPNGNDCFSAFPSGYYFMGENLAEATGVLSASDFAQGCVKYWMESPSHRDNILNSSYTHTAVAVVVSGGCMYAVQSFGTPA